jgi:hypothetical protein
MIICHRKRETTLPSIQRLVESEHWQLKKMGIDSEKNICEKMYDENNNLHIIPKKEGVLEKMNTKRYLYLVETKNFVPHEKGSNVKFFSQVPVMILQTVKINNVYKDYFAN